ncbi:MULTISPECIES: (Na+)-NQR maturation NqrM [unclassified Oceanobacter]|uniref:(Na+)-NQR maturation NqrM n=1 Tax=unclassified Oceanobacter TaxID=2620260 RepID=UPI0026E3B39D|nr:MULTISPECIES: (Na+)-NQR maturation NqrM [unclassified Oceanobacter]MDO6681137.1 (Na+)-NQR maturation NqrM [Oceanobacter sp. 5_MG-2023]MDP2504291.1 (Na+)-NQR maturation NqrM [Oceanobacter sp. 3_MG-2023]MDP2546729.1 (Na+)-NQR maturation NqrM [Oceanobacter sp. 4_MG-2023]
MTMMLVAFAVMLLIVAAMAVGVLMGRKPISGSCGGMAAIGMESACDVCGGDKKKCEKESKIAAAKSVGAEFYDATKR